MLVSPRSPKIQNENLLIRSCATGQSHVLIASDKAQFADRELSKLQVHGCSVKGDIMCCKMSMTIEVESRTRLHTCVQNGTDTYCTAT